MKICWLYMYDYIKCAQEIGEVTYVEIKFDLDFSWLFENFHRIVKWMLTLTVFQCSNNSDLTRTFTVLVNWSSACIRLSWLSLAIFVSNFSPTLWVFERVVNNRYFEIWLLLTQLCNNCAKMAVELETMTSLPLTKTCWICAVLCCKEVKELPTIIGIQ